MNEPGSSIEDSYGYCRQMARRSRSNFYPSFMLLPREKRMAMDALYAFMRHTDDLGDNEDPPQRRGEALQLWREQLLTALGEEAASATQREPAVLILPALADAVGRYNIPAESLTDVIEGVEMDLVPRRYQTFDELAEYCHRVASAVGLACIHIWGFDGPAAIEPARKCGLAMQLTNILRDLKEDAEAERIYLPEEDFHNCGYTPEQLCRGETGAGFERLVELEFERARSFYRDGSTLFEHLQPDGRRIFGMMMSVYYRLLLKVRRSGSGILDGRVRLSRFEKLRIAGRWLIAPPGRLILD